MRKRPMMSKKVDWQAITERKRGNDGDQYEEQRARTGTGSVIRVRRCDGAKVRRCDGARV